MKPLVADTFAGYQLDQVSFFADHTGGVPFNAEPQLQGHPIGAQQPQRILVENSCRDHANLSGIEVPAAVADIDQGTGPGVIGQGIDRKIPQHQVRLDGIALGLRHIIQGVLAHHPKNALVSLAQLYGARLMKGCELACIGFRIPEHHDVIILGPALEEQIAYGSAHQIGRLPGIR